MGPFCKVLPKDSLCWFSVVIISIQSIIGQSLVIVLTGAIASVTQAFCSQQHWEGFLRDKERALRRPNRCYWMHTPAAFLEGIVSLLYRPAWHRYIKINNNNEIIIIIKCNEMFLNHQHTIEDRWKDGGNKKYKTTSLCKCHESRILHLFFKVEKQSIKKSRTLNKSVC